MSVAEMLAAAVTAGVATAPLLAYAMDAAGLSLAPHVVLAASVTVGGTTALCLWRDRRAGVGDLVAWLGVVLSIGAWLLILGRPSWLPPGRGSDLAHHLLLVDYIERHQTLVRDLSLEGAMGEMAYYTPGAHVLAVLAGFWTGTDGFRAFYPMLATAAALTAGFLFLIARRLHVPIPFAIIAVMLLLLPREYFSGAFTHDSFLAQTMSALFTVAAWWVLAAWDERPSRVLAALFGLIVAGVFLTWPVWIGPPILVFAALLLGRGGPASERLRHCALGVVPLMVIAAIHLSGRWRWLLMVGTSGAVPALSMATVGWVFPTLAAIGVALSVPNRRARVTVALLLVIVVQAVTLLVAAKANGADTPYMAFKMAYLAIYPLAILGAVAVYAGVPGARGTASSRGAAGTIGWVIATVMVVVVVRPMLAEPRPVPVVSIELYEAGRWTREHVGQTCADYLVADADTAYWLHLAVLGNPRSSPRMAEIDRFHPNAAIGQWVTADGLGYAVADLRRLPDEVRRRVEVMAQFGTAAVIRRPGAAPCGSP